MVGIQLTLHFSYYINSDKQTVKKGKLKILCTEEINIAFLLGYILLFYQEKY